MAIAFILVIPIFTYRWVQPSRARWFTGTFAWLLLVWLVIATDAAAPIAAAHDTPGVIYGGIGDLARAALAVALFVVGAYFQFRRVTTLPVATARSIDRAPR